MAKKKTPPTPLKTPSGMRILASLKDGWRAHFVNGSLLLVHPESHPYLIDLKTVKEGDTLPRDTDTPVEPAPGLGGH